MDGKIGIDINAQNFYSIFKGRTDRVAIFNNPTSKVISIEVKKGDYEITSRADTHLKGQTRLALYNQLADNTCTWANIIFNESSKMPTARDSLLFAQDCAIAGLTEVKREKTKTKGQNYACWMFFANPISAKKVRYLISLILKRLEIQKAEVLPAEDMLTAGSQGMYAWLPYFGGTDNWIDPNGEKRTDLGVKTGFTVFINEDGEPLKAPWAKIHKYTENEIDNAILYFEDYIPSDPTPGEGVEIKDSHIKKVLEKCDAVKNILAELKKTNTLNDKILELLGPLFVTWRRTDYLHKLISKTKGYDKAFIDKKLDSLPVGTPFTLCSAFKAAGYCPADKKECFAPKAPIVERYGRLEEDNTADKTKYREFSPAVWGFQAIRERISEEQETETAVIDAEATDFIDQMETFESELVEQRNLMIKSRRPCSGLSTGLACLNRDLDGLRPDFLTVVAGIQGCGKNTLCSQAMEHCAAEKKNALYITYGDTKSTVISKLLARCSGIDYRKIIRGALSDEEMARLNDTIKKIKDSYGPYMFFVEGNDAMGIRKIRSIIDSMDVHLLIIDSLNMIPFISKNQLTDIHSRIEQNVRQLKTIARYKKIPILATLSTRDKDSNISELVYTESLVMQACDNWIQLEEGKPLDPQQQAKEYIMYIRKNRAGDKNLAYRLAYQPSIQRFVEMKQ